MSLDTECGKLVGVTGQTIYNWEQGRTRPGEEQMGERGRGQVTGKREAVRRSGASDSER
jgi:hypothetical protein